MKRYATLLLVFLLALCLGTSALADVIYEPNNNFFNAHEDECIYENRVYILNGPDGYVTLCHSPEGKAPLRNRPNGREYLVIWIWDGGDLGLWGLVNDYDEEYERVEEMWVPLKDTVLKYDAISFAEEHGSEFRHLETGEWLDLSGYGRLQLWPYPGAETPINAITWTGEDGWLSAPPDPLYYETTYEDGDGLLWMNIGYLYGYRNFWVCITDPESEDLSALRAAFRPADAPAETPAPTATSDLIPPAEVVPPAVTSPPTDGDGTFPWLPAGLAAGAVVVAGGLLAIFRKKK
jgi:hypothetical protein